MTDDEIDAKINELNTEKSQLMVSNKGRSLWIKTMELIHTLRKERDTYRFLLERETKRFQEFMHGNYAPI